MAELIRSFNQRPKILTPAASSPKHRPRNPWPPIRRLKNDAANLKSFLKPFRRASLHLTHPDQCFNLIAPSPGYGADENAGSYGRQP